MGRNAEVVKEVYSNYRPQEPGVLWEASTAQRTLNEMGSVSRKVPEHGDRLPTWS
jgi:hypothetical protein